jgi:hypothetical protein
VKVYCNRCVGLGISISWVFCLQLLVDNAEFLMIFYLSISFLDGGKFVVWVLLEYVRSLTDFHIPVQHYLHELVINSLVQHKAYYQLHQLLQYHVVSDSKPLVSTFLRRL